MATERLNPTDPLLEALRSAAAHFGPELAATAYDRGLAVTAATEETTSGANRPKSELAGRYGASAEETTPDPKQAYAHFERSERGRPEYWDQLPWAQVGRKF
jgi:cysteine synthase